MSATMNDFLLEYYKRLIFREMPIEQFVHFCEFVDADDLGGNMKSWKEELLKKDPTSGEYLKNAKLYVRKDLPDPEEAGGEWELLPEEWEKLFRAFNNAFQAMDANKKSFKYEKKPNDFLNKYFGNSGQLFSYAVADGAAEAKITELNKILSAHEADMKQMLKEYFNDDFSWKDLMDGISSKKYNKDPKFRKRMVDIAEALEYDTKYNVPSPVLSMVGYKLNFDSISKGFENNKINSAKLTQFKLIYPELLKELYTNTKAFEFFSANDPTKISKMLSEAKSWIDYNDKDSKSYITPKRQDELTLPQRISEWWDDTYSNYLEKYVKLTGDRMFFSPYAKAIFKEIDKAKIKPADGLAKILENTEKISGELKKKYKKAPDHFDWFVKTLNELKSSMGKGKAFEKALQNGRSMQILIQEIIVKAVRENKIDEAKTTMELLATMRYTLTTSKIMDAFNKSDLTIFSDKNLSWNKNEGVKFVATAMDKGIKKAFQLVGYTLTAAGNLVNRIGTKFNGHPGKRIAAARDATNADNEAKLQKLRDIELPSYKAGKIEEENNLAHLRSKGITETALDSKIDTYVNTDLPAIMSDFDSHVASLKTWVSANTSHPDAAYVADALNAIKSYKIDAELDKGVLTALTEPTVITDMQALFDKQKEYKLVNSRLERKRRKRQEMQDATDAINNYNDMITKTKDEISKWDDNHKDKYKELMAYWDICNSGIVKSWFGNAKESQKAFDKKKKALFDEYLADYNIR